MRPPAALRGHSQLATTVLAIVVATAAAACGPAGPATGQPPAGATAAPPAATASPPAVPTDAPALTPVPGGVTAEPVPTGTRVATTQTEWGEILDAVPATFPVLPDAQTTEWPDEAVSGAWLADTGVDAVASWYRDELASQGWGQVELSDPLEDGTRVLDAWADIPECRLQVAFRPAGESTIITVLYGAACAGG